MKKAIATILVLVLMIGGIALLGWLTDTGYIKYVFIPVIIIVFGGYFIWIAYTIAMGILREFKLFDE